MLDYETENQKEESLQDYLQFIRKYAFIICLSTLSVLGTALTISLRLPKTYSASTLMQLVRSNPASSMSSANLFQTVLSGGVDRREMATISERFATESMLTAALETLEEDRQKGLRHFPGIGNLRRNIRAQIRADADYIELSLELTETEGGERNAALLVNQLARDMQTLRSETEKAELAKHQRFLKRKQDEIRQETGKIIDDILQFVRENGSPEIWGPTLTNLLTQHQNLQERLGAAERALRTARFRLAHLQKQQDVLPKQTQLSETSNHNPIWLYQQEKLFDLESQRIGDTEKVGKSLSDIRGLKAQIDEIQKKTEETPKIATTTTHGTSPHYTYIQNQLIELPPTIKGYQNETEQLREELRGTEEQLQHIIGKIPEAQHNFVQLNAKLQLANTMMEEIAKRSLEAEILSTESDVTIKQKGGIEIVDIAVPRKIPVAPQFKFIVILSGSVGICLGITLALLIEYFRKHAEES